MREGGGGMKVSVERVSVSVAGNDSISVKVNKDVTKKKTTTTHVL